MCDMNMRKCDCIQYMRAMSMRDLIVRCLSTETAVFPLPSTPALTSASDTGFSSTDRLISLTTPSFTGTVQNLSVVALYINGTYQSNATATSGGVYTVTSSTLAAGFYFVKVVATSVAGNTANSSQSNFTL